MTVGELIEKLQAMPQDARVVVDGYEGGVDDAADPALVTIALNVNASTWMGKHEVVDDMNRDRFEGVAQASAVHL
jgi:hypothetical protein